MNDRGNATMAVILSIFALILTGTTVGVVVDTLATSRAASQQDALSASVNSRYAQYRDALRAGTEPDLSETCEPMSTLCVSITSVTDHGTSRTITFSATDSTTPQAEPLTQARVIIEQGGSHITGYSETGAAIWADASGTRAVALRQIVGSCAVDTHGYVWCDGAIVQVATPTTSLASGVGFACARDRHGAVSCWGDNSQGQLGIGSTASSPTPVTVNGNHQFATLAAAGTRVCGTDTTGSVLCWGDATTTPQSVGAYTGIALAADGGCALDATQTAWCWGDNSLGQLGDGSTTAAASPVAVSGGHHFAVVAAAPGYRCGIDTTGSTWCWGDNSLGQLGDTSTTASAVPVQVQSGAAQFASLALTGTSCGLTIDSSVYCWGDNRHGQIGNGTTIPQAAPVQVSVGGPVAEVRGISTAMCAFRSDDGVLLCWGSVFGAPDITTPTAITTPKTLVSVASEVDRACALSIDGSRFCFGGVAGNDLVEADTLWQTLTYEQFEAYRQ